MPAFVLSTRSLALEHRMEEICAIGAFAGALPPAQGLRMPVSDAEFLQRFAPEELPLQRVLSRAGVLALGLLPKVRAFLGSKPTNAGRIGLYGSFSPAAIVEPLLADLLSARPEEIARVYRRKCPPSFVLKSGRNIPLGQLATLLEAAGPTLAFPSWRNGVRHCAEAAALDFRHGRIDLALLFASSSLENCLANAEILRARGPSTLAEAAAVAALESADEAEHLFGAVREDPNRSPASPFFGNAHPLVMLEESMRTEGSP